MNQERGEDKDYCGEQKLRGVRVVLQILFATHLEKPERSANNHGCCI